MPNLKIITLTLDFVADFRLQTLHLTRNNIITIVMVRIKVAICNTFNWLNVKKISKNDQQLIVVMLSSLYSFTERSTEASMLTR